MPPDLPALIAQAVRGVAGDITAALGPGLTGVACPAAVVGSGSMTDGGRGAGHGWSQQRLGAMSVAAVGRRLPGSG